MNLLYLNERKHKIIKLSKLDTPHIMGKIPIKIGGTTGHKLYIDDYPCRDRSECQILAR
jgi:hypothetical protein